MRDGTPAWMVGVGALMRHRRDIDGLRALAVIPVVLFHARREWFPGGFVGVDVFFVISGFLVARLLVSEIRLGPLDLWRFYDRRVRRLLPAFLCFLIFSAIAACIFLLPSEMRIFARSSIAAILFASNIFFWRSADYFGPDAEANPLLHTWSLAVEEQYYVLFPIALAIIFRFGWSRHLPALIMTAALASLILAEVLLSRSPPAAFYLLPTRAWELLVGAWLACRSPGPAPRRSLANVAGICGLLLILAPMILYDDHTRFPGLGALPVCIGTLLILWSGDRNKTSVSHLLSARPLVWIGLISYSLYLWHWPLLAFPEIVLQRALATDELLVSIVAALAISTLSWRYVEQPFRGPPKAYHGSGRQPRTVTLSVTIAVAVLLGMTPLLDGGQWRTPALVNQLDAPGASPAPATPCEMFANRPASCPRSALPIVVLWGDSHAAHYHRALAGLGRERGFDVRIASLAGCAPLPHSELASAQGAVRADCQKFNDDVLQELRGSPGVRLVILSARWNRFFFDSTDPELMMLGPTGSGDDAPADRLAEGLEATLDDLSRMGLINAVIGPGPEFVLPLPGCLARPVWQRRPASNCVLHPHTKPGEKGDAVVAAVLAEYPATLTIRPYDSLCPRGRCHTVVMGRPALIDTDHLSYHAAEQVLRSVDWPELRRDQ